MSVRFCSSLLLDPLLLLLHVKLCLFVLSLNGRRGKFKTSSLLFRLSCFLVLVLSGCFRVLQAATCPVPGLALRSGFTATEDQLGAAAMLVGRRSSPLVSLSVILHTEPGFCVRRLVLL